MDGYMDDVDNDINQTDFIFFLVFLLHSRLTMASHKITKLAGAKPTDEFELNVAQALVDLENNVADLKKDLRPLSITAAKEVRVTTTISATSLSPASTYLFFDENK